MKSQEAAHGCDVAFLGAAAIVPFLLLSAYVYSTSFMPSLNDGFCTAMVFCLCLFVAWTLAMKTGCFSLPQRIVVGSLIVLVLGPLLWIYALLFSGFLFDNWP